MNTYAWDSNARPVTINRLGITYDALGRMVERNNAGYITQVVYAATGNKLAIMTGQTLVWGYVPLPDGTMAQYGSGGTMYYRHSDWQGSARLVSSATRTVYADIAYGPFGEQYVGSGSTDVMFTGMNQDTYGNISDFPAREYSIQGRWPSPDPAGLGAVDPSTPQSFNRYAYALNSPLNLIDPQGTDPIRPCGPQNVGEANCPGERPGGSGCLGATPGTSVFYACGGWQGFAGGGPWMDPFDFVSTNMAGTNTFLEEGSCFNCFDAFTAASTLFGPNPFGNQSLGKPSVNTASLVPSNPCSYQGRALPPSAYATAGQAANPQAGGSASNFFADAIMGFPRGSYLDPQPLASGNSLQRAAYGNYVFGVYMAGAGVSLSQALSGANAFAFFSGATYGPRNGPRDSTYGSLPAANVTNIVYGFLDQANGTTCGPAPPAPPTS